MTNPNIEYYNENAQSFIEGTLNVDMSLWRDKFETCLPNGGRVLDAGCGSGRDSRAFKMHGFSVEAFDASREMCKAASEVLAQEVWQMKFEEISFDEEFDGVWACASLLHVTYEDLPAILGRLKKALKNKGHIYVSFKYGNETMTKGSRTFSNFNEDTVADLLEEAGFELLERGISSDIRPGRGEEKWINAIGRLK